VTGDRYRLFPVLDDRFDGIDQNRSPKHGAVQNRADRAVRAFPHFVQIILGHPLRVRRDRRAFDSDAVLFDSVAGFMGYAVSRFVAFLKPKVIVLGIEFDERQQKLILYHFPDDPRHFVSVHLHNGISHPDLCHIRFPF
jgi:hypothetical protein